MKKTSLFFLFGLTLSLLSTFFIGNHFDSVHPVLANEETHFHYDKDGERVDFNPIYNMDDFVTLLSEGGNAYLANDITFTDHEAINDGELIVYSKNINLCLNGHVLNLNGKCHLRSQGNAKGHHFSIYDCNKTIEHRFDTSSNPWKLDSSGDTIIKNGVITGGCGMDGDQGGFLDLGEDDDVLTIYGGSIVGNKASTGGAVCSWHLFIYGGELCGNKAEMGGGAVYCTDSSRFTVDNAKIHHNQASLGGGILSLCLVLDETAEIVDNIDDDGNDSNVCSVFVFNNLTKNSEIGLTKFDDFGLPGPTIFEKIDDANDFLLADNPELHIVSESKENLDNEVQMYTESFVEELNISLDKIFVLDQNGKNINEICNFVMKDYCINETPATPSATATFGTPLFSYSTEEYGVYTETQPTEIGKYWVRAKVEESANYYKAVAKKQFEIKEAAPESPIVIDIEGGVPDDVSVTVEVTVETEVESAIQEQKITDYSTLPEDVKLEKFESVGIVFDVKLIRTIAGVSSEIQPSDIKPGTIVKVKIKIPDDVDISKVSRIIHVHSADDVESYAFDPSKIDEDGYYTLNLDKFSELAFVYNISSEFDIKKANNLTNTFETILILKAIGYDVEYNEENNDFGILDIVNAPNEAALRTAYFNSLKLLDEHVDNINQYRLNKIEEISQYASINEVIVTSGYLSYFESIYTISKLDEATIIVKSEIDDVAIMKAALDTKLDELDDGVDAVKTAIDDGFSDTSTAITGITTTINAINALLNDNTNGLAKINLNIDSTKTAIVGAITTATNTLTQLINSKASEISSAVATLSGKTDSNYADILSKIADLKTLVDNTKSLITTSGTAIEHLDQLIGETEDAITGAITTATNTLTQLINSKASEISSAVATLSGKTDTNYADILSKIADLKTLVDNTKSLITSTSGTAIEHLDQLIGDTEDAITDAITTATNTLTQLINSKIGEINSAVATLSGKTDTNYADILSKIADLKTLVDNTKSLITSTSGTAIEHLDQLIGETEDAIKDAISTTASTLTQHINSKIGEINSAIVALTGNTDPNFVDILSKITEVKTLVENTKTLVNSSSSAVNSELKNAILEAEMKNDNCIKALDAKIVEMEVSITSNNSGFIVAIIVISVVCVLSLATTGFFIFKEFFYKKETEVDESLKDKQ